MQSPMPDSSQHAAPRSFPDAYSVPVLGPRQERFIRVVALAALAYGAYWIYWRWTASLNWDAPAFSLLLVVAETYALLTTAMLFLTVGRLSQRTAPPPLEGRSVDVFITCYDEPLQLLRRTAIGARAIRYPHRTWILDDGKRNEVRALCRELGIGYLRRRDNAHAKAGNLNHALKRTRGEFILQLDADHVPLPDILDRILGFFADPAVAFVQTPQDFYNTDSFTHVVDDEGRRMWEENRIFFSLIQPGKDVDNAAFFCGSCGVLRRSALAEVGGFSTVTITEDMETSMLLHARGWKSVYYGETLAYGLAPASAGQYHVQRLRWGQGAMQILRRMNPLVQRGLTWRQRLAYFSSCVTYLDGYQKLVFYLAPVIFFVTGALPVRVTDMALLVRLVPYLVLTILSFELLSRGTGWLLISERYNMTKFFTYMVAVTGFFAKGTLRFNVTPKGVGEVPFRTYAPQLAVGVLSGLSLVWAIVAARRGWVSYPGGTLATMAFVLNGAWVCWNMYFAGYVVAHSVRSRTMREDHRFIDRIPVAVGVAGAEGHSRVVYAITRDLNVSGLSFRATEAIGEGAEVRIRLPLASRVVETVGIVTRRTERRGAAGTVVEYGVRFDKLPIDTRDAIEVHCAHHAVPMWRARYRQSVNLFSHAYQRLAEMRGGHRRSVELPALVHVDDDAGTSLDLGLGLLEEVSKRGARLVLGSPLPPGTRIRFAVPGTTLAGEGRVVFSRSMESPLNVRFAVGIEKAREPRRSFLWFPFFRHASPAAPGPAAGAAAPHAPAA